MEVKIDPCTGFCFGVKRAVDTVYEQLKKGKTIYTYGPIVHNEEVIRELEEQGVRVLDDVQALKALPCGKACSGEAAGNSAMVIICAHGVSKQVYEMLEEKGL